VPVCGDGSISALIDGRAASGTGFVFVLFRYAFWIMILTTAVYLFLLWQSGLAHTLLEKLLRYARFRDLYDRKPRIRRLITKLLDEAGHFQDTIRQLNRKNSLHFLVPLFYTVVFWGLFYSIAPILLLGLGVVPDIRAAITWQVMIMLIIPYIPVPGGSGVAEFGLATLFAPFVPSHILGVFIVAWRFFTYYLTLIFGGLSTFVLKAK
jgi:glycosyltransferase 2 family protein